MPEHEVALASTQLMVRAIAEHFDQAGLMDTWTYVVWLDSGAEVPALEFALVVGEVSGVFRVGLSALGEDLPLQETFVVYP